MLAELYEKLMSNARTRSQDLPVGSINRDSEYDQLHFAEVLDLNGNNLGTATIDRTGDIVGMSPGERCTLNGVTRWIPLERLQNLRTTPFLTEPGLSAPSGRSRGRNTATAAK